MMISKKEIEKAKERLKEKVEDEKILGMLAHIDTIIDENILNNKSIETLLQYIQELEVSNKELDKENNRLEKIEFERDKLNKMVDEMSEQLAGLTIWNNEKEEPIILGDKEEVKQYFEKKVATK